MSRPTDSLAGRLQQTNLSESSSDLAPTGLQAGDASDTATSSPPGKDGQVAAGDAVGVTMPPGMASVKQYTADEVVNMLNKTPLFMTELDETDAEGGENLELEALKALAYEGTRAEIAQNFREQGNDLAKAKRWADAKEYYSQALAALKMPPSKEQLEEESGKEQEEAKRRQELEELCCVNRALCHLELKNYRSCNLDCAATLRLNPRNVKAWYRSASACLALDKIPEAADACERGLAIDPANAALKALSNRISARETHLSELARKRRERIERERAEAATLQLALKQRNIPSRQTDRAPELEDAAMKLADPLDAASTLTLPVVLLYPLHLQSDFVKAAAETETLAEILAYVLPPPWDEAREYAADGAVECYLETPVGGLVKAGKKLPLSKILASGKVEIVDGLLTVSVVPRARAKEWIDEFKAKKAPTRP